MRRRRTSRAHQSSMPSSHAWHFCEAVLISGIPAATTAGEASKQIHRSPDEVQSGAALSCQRSTASVLRILGGSARDVSVSTMHTIGGMSYVTSTSVYTDPFPNLAFVIRVRLSMAPLDVVVVAPTMSSSE